VPQPNVAAEDTSEIQIWMLYLQEAADKSEFSSPPGTPACVKLAEAVVPRRTRTESDCYASVTLAVQNARTA